MRRLSVNALRSCALLPNAGVKTAIATLYTFTLPLFTLSVSINKPAHPEIDAKTRIELRPITVNAFPYDVIRISAPVINEQAMYYIHKPNGDAMKLNIVTPKLREMLVERDVQPIVARYIRNLKPVIVPSNNNEGFSIRGRNSEDVFKKKLDQLEENDFLIGPLLAEDHGNWVLSVYTKDLNDGWIEMFQVISVTITEFVPLEPSTPTLNPGDTLKLSIAFPIPNLETCELVAPRSTFDRLYYRSQADLKNCGFFIPNLTKQDSGVWKIIAVGDIVYEGEMFLEFNTSDRNNNTLNTKTAQYILF